MLVVFETLTVAFCVIALIGVVMLGIMIQSGVLSLPGSSTRRIQQAEADAKVAQAKVRIAEAQHREAVLQLGIDAVHTKRLALASGDDMTVEEVDGYIVLEDNS